MEPVLLVCGHCSCRNAFEKGWDTDDQSIIGDAALLLHGDTVAEIRKQCTHKGDCSCHTGVGLMPRWHVHIGTETLTEKGF
jgi:hypothetical protein